MVLQQFGAVLLEPAQIGIDLVDLGTHLLVGISYVLVEVEGSPIPLVSIKDV